MTAEDFQPAYLRFQQTDNLLEAEFTVSSLTEDLNIDQLGQELFTLLDRSGCLRMIVSLEQVDYVTSAALGKLITLHRRLHRQEGRLVLYGVHGSVTDVLETSRLLDYFHIADDREAALAQV